MKTVKADIVVIAAGMAGLSASIAAAEKKASVIVFEKGSTTGGAGSMGMGFFAAGSHHQKSQMIDITPESAFARFMEYMHWRADARLVRKFMELSAGTVEWVENMGVEILGAFKYFLNSEATWHIVKVPGADRPVAGSASILSKAMTERAKELGVKFHFRTPAKKILYTNGRLAGVIAEDANGEEIKAECGCVIVATGGCGDSPEMIKKYTGYEHGKNLFSFRIPGLTGDGIRMVWEIGGGQAPMNIEMTYDTPGVFGGGFTLRETGRQPNLMVNLDGKRFINEEIMNNTPFTGNAIALQRECCAFTIVTDNIINYYKEQGLDYIVQMADTSRLENWDAEIRNYLTNTGSKDAPPMDNGFGDQKGVFVADSIEDLAAQTGIDKENLRTTIAEYNESAVSGDKLFNKNKRYIKPILGPRYYVFKHLCSGYGTLGGIRINDNMQVLSKAGKVMPGVYAAGTDACSIFMDSYIFYLPGSTMGFAINSGRMAGYNAADNISSADNIK